MTKVEREWMDRITRLGCIVCFHEGRGYVPTAVHHILQGGRRKGHLYTIPLCDPGHHKGMPDSRHPYKKRFEEKYGTEESLLEDTQLLVSLSSAPYSQF